MDCSEFLFTDREALDALTGFATRFAAYYKTLCFCAPADLDLSYYCDNYAHSLSARQLITNGMTRVVNVRRALELARYRGSRPGRHRRGRRHAAGKQRRLPRGI